MKTKIFAIIITITIILVSSSLLFTQAHAKEKIRIGFSISITGPYAAGAIDQMRAYEMWLEEVNKEGGIFVKDVNKKLPVEFVYYDDKGETGTAVKIYEKLMEEEKVDLLLTPFGSTLVFAVMPIADKYKIPMLGATAASTKIRKVNPKYFWFITPCQPDKVMNSMVNFLKAHQIKKVAVIYAQDLFEVENMQFLKPELKKAGIATVLSLDYPFGVKDLTQTLAKVKASNAEALIALNAYVDTILLARQAKEQNLQLKVFYVLLGPQSDFYIKVLGPTSEGIMSMGVWNPKIKWPGAKEFYDRFISKYNKIPNLLDSVHSYQEGQILEQAITKAGTLNWERIREVIEREEFSTIGGPVKFIGRENYQTPPMIDQIQNGEHEIVWPPEYATANPIIPMPPQK